MIVVAAISMVSNREAAAAARATATATAIAIAAAVAFEVVQPVWPAGFEPKAASLNTEAAQAARADRTQRFDRAR